MDFKIDVIIATYNRIVAASNLAQSLIDFGDEYIKNVILIDSTDNQEKKIFESNKIIHLLTKFKNQPFQRYVGFKYSTAEILLFLDDDMEIIDCNFLRDLVCFFQQSKYDGLNIPFDNKNYFISNQPISFLKTKNVIFDKLRGIITGYPRVKENSYNNFGIKGERKENQEIAYFNGGAFAVKGRKLYDNFNMQHFDLYEENLGMGEDGLLGFSFSIDHKIWSWDRIYLVHNDMKNSTYALNLVDSSKRYLYSRINLSYEYYRLKKIKIKYPFIKYLHFAIFRLLGSFIIFILRKDNRALQITKGYWMALLLVRKFSYSNNLIRNSSWKKAAEFEILSNLTSKNV